MNQQELEKFIVKEFLGETNYAQTDGVKWWFVVYGLAEASEWQARVDNHPAFKVTDTQNVPDGGFVIEFKFTVPPRVAYDSANQPAILELMHRIGALERENARLRAAGLALVSSMLDESEGTQCTVCGRGSSAGVKHAADCPVWVFIERATVTLVLTMTDGTQARYPGVSASDADAVREALAGKYTHATEVHFTHKGETVRVDMMSIKDVETE